MMQHQNFCFKKNVEWSFFFKVSYQLCKQTNKAIYSFSDIQAPGLHTIQYYNIYTTVVKMMIKIKATKTIYIEDPVHHVGR